MKKYFRVIVGSSDESGSTPTANWQLPPPMESFILAAGRICDYFLAGGSGRPTELRDLTQQMKFITEFPMEQLPPEKAGYFAAYLGLRGIALKSELYGADDPDGHRALAMAESMREKLASFGPEVPPDLVHSFSRFAPEWLFTDENGWIYLLGSLAQDREVLIRSTGQAAGGLFVSFFIDPGPEVRLEGRERAMARVELRELYRVLVHRLEDHPDDRQEMEYEELRERLRGILRSPGGD